jgi:putative ABC transport system permease protein
MSTPPSPPRLAERLVALTVRDEEWRASVLGDLFEEFQTMREQSGAARARRWYWRTAVAVGGRTLRSALRRPTRMAWTTAVADDRPRAGWRAGLGREVTHATRSLWRQPGLALVVLTTLALALAANSTILAVLDALVLRPYRFADVDRMVVAASSDPQQGLFDRESVAAADFSDWRDGAPSLAHLSAAEWWDANLSGVDEPEQVAGFRVSADFFETFAIQPIVGRAFLDSEGTPGQHRRVVLSHALWTRRFAADPGVVGRTIRFDGEPYEVVGIAPAGFTIPLGAQVWSPIAYSDQQWTDRRGSFLTVFGRLAPGRTIEEARGELSAVAERLRREYPDTNASRPFALVEFMTGMADPGASAFLSVWQAASILLLLIACANIANLLLARGAERSQEFAMRLALGAGRLRLATQLFIEGTLLALAAVALAVPLAWVGIGLSRASIPASVIRFVPGWHYLQLSVPVFLTTAALGLIAMVLFSLVPALQASRAGVMESLRAGARTMTSSRHRQWLRNGLAAVQVALTLALLFGSGLMLSAADKSINGVLGFDKSNLLIGRLVLPERPYESAERRRQFSDTVLERLRQIPAVSSAAVVSALPYGGANTGRRFWPEGVTLAPADVRTVDFRRASPDYLQTMRIPLLFGRGLSATDRDGSQPVAVVSQQLAERYWPTVDPIGRRFKLAEDGQWITVVGVAGDVVHDWFQQIRRPTVYRPALQDPPFAHAFVVRTVSAPISVASELRRAVGVADPDQPIIELKSMSDLMDDRAAGVRSIARSLSVVALIALVLAVMGLYSLMAFNVSRRTHELGVRMALGATRWQVIGLTARQGIRITVAGLLLGGIAAAAIGRLMESTLFGVVSSSLTQLALLVLFVAAVSLAATYVPARRTTRVEPMSALRSD